MRRGVGLGAEIGREVCRRHFYFVKGSARERADRADIAHAGFDDLRRELQSGLSCLLVVSRLRSKFLEAKTVLTLSSKSFNLGSSVS